MQQDTIQRLEGGRRTRGVARSKPPFVSIITVVFRAKDELENILNNVFQFDTCEFELIVIDGGSRDGTLELLHQWDEKIDYWLSEPDSGIYDAMNKARDLAQGEFLYHLNAGDRLIYLPVQELHGACMEPIDAAAFRVSVDGKREFIPSCGHTLRFKNTLHHQGTFYRRKTFPAYDTQYKVLADFDLNQRMVVRGAKVRTFDNVVAEHSTEGVSNWARVADAEHFQIIYKNHGWLPVAVSWIQRKWDGFMARAESIS
jgi:glycosyltransferase involved in cell wall biosynthesis